MDISRWQAPPARSHRIGIVPNVAPQRGAGVSATPPESEMGAMIRNRWLRAFGAGHRLISSTPPA